MEMKELLDLVAKEKASDLLITAGAPPMLRINGQLHRTDHATLTPDQTEQLIFRILTPDQKIRFEAGKELDFSFAAGRKRRFRVNVYLQKQAVTAAFRPIPDQAPSLNELGLPKEVEKLAEATQGFILVTGPSGQGKTTTQAALIDLINTTRSCHIITVEDPIEYIHTHKRSIVDQRETGADTHSFANALRHVLRQSPDVIFVGEMRDLETMQAAIRAAEMGHLVLATLHTNDSVQTIDRIIDVFPGDQQQQIRFQLSMTLLAIICQRLLPRADGKGRVLAYEFLRCNTAIANLIREGKTQQVYSVLETNTKDGMITMDRCIKNLYLQGLVSYEDAIAYVRDRKEIMNVAR